MCNNAMLFSEESYWHIINRFIFGFQLLWSLFYTLNLHLYLVALIYLHQMYFCVDVPLWVDKWIRTTVPNSMQHIYRFTYWYCMNHSLRSNHDRCDSLSLTAFHQTKGASVLWRKNLCSFEGFHPECSPSPLISIYLLYNYCIFFYSLVCNNGSNLWSGAHTDERGSQGRETRNKHRERREDIILFCNTCTTRWHFCRYNTVLPPNSCEVIGEASRRSITQSPMCFFYNCEMYFPNICRLGNFVMTIHYVYNTRHTARAIFLLLHSSALSPQEDMKCWYNFNLFIVCVGCEDLLIFTERMKTFQQ